MKPYWGWERKCAAVLLLLAAVPLMAQTTVRCEAEKMGGASYEADAGALGGMRAYPSGLPGVQIKDNVTLPYSSVWNVWLRYLDNGQRSVSITVNATTYNSPAPTGSWTWMPAGSFSGSNVSIQIKSTGAVGAIVDSLIFDSTGRYDPRSYTFSTWSGYPEIQPTVGFAQGLLNQNPNIATSDWINQVGAYYNYPAVAPSTVVDSYGNILLNGQPWFHLGMFHSGVTDPVLSLLPQINAYSGWADSSWPDNVVSVSSYNQLWTQYDYLARNFGPYAGRSKLFYHYICDEPENTGVSAAQLDRLNALVKRMDPTKPTYINVANGNVANASVLTVPDVVGLDYYPVPSSRVGQRISEIGQGIDSVRYFSDLRPMVFTVESFTWNPDNLTSFPYPTAVELRAMTWSALVHNARSLWFYEWPVAGHSGHTLATDQPALWADLQTLMGQIASIVPALQGPEVVKPFTAVVQAPAGASAAEFRVAVDAARNVAYLIAVNPRQADENWPSRVRLDFTGGPLTDIQLSSVFTNQTASAAMVSPGVWDISFSCALGSGVFAVNSACLGNLVQMSHDQAKAMLRTSLGLTQVAVQGEDFPGVTTDVSTAYVAGKMGYIGSALTTAAVTLPASIVPWDLTTSWSVWVRLCDNGSQGLDVTINGTTTHMAATGGNWVWTKLPTSVAYSVINVTVGLQGTGSLAAMVDCVVFSKDPTFNPANLTVDQLNPPVISPAGGTFTPTQAVTLTHSNPSAVIRYTLDGSEPSESSPLYTGPLSLAYDVTFKARAWSGAVPGLSSSASFLFPRVVNFVTSGSGKDIVLSRSNPTFSTDLSTWNTFIGKVWGILGACNTNLQTELVYLPGNWGSLGPGLIRIDSTYNWFTGYVVYKFVTAPGTVTTGGTVSCDAAYRGNLNQGDGPTMGIGTSVTYPGNLSSISNYSGFTRTDMTTGTDNGYSTYYKTMTLNIPTGLSTFFVAISKGGYSSAFAFDNLTVSATTGYNLAGTVILKDFSGDNSSVLVTVQLRGGTTSTESPALDANGNFTITNVSPGTYNVWIKPSHWLAERIDNVTVSTGPVNLGSITFVNGDCDNDNAVTVSDLSIVLANLDGAPFSSAADLNGSGGVDSTDLSTVLTALDRSGKP